MASSLVGRKLGKYDIIELLGRGGMATVYKGRQSEIDRFVAVKVLPPHPGQDPQFIERFQLEARTIARLQHPHILPLYDYGMEDDILYLATAYVSGGSLEDRIKQGAMPLGEVERLLRQIASALDYAHRQNVIHRDIKPGNILLDGEGHALLADFGIVKITGGDSRLTGTGGMVGTPAYMSPEQGTGVNITASVDIYALGAVVYEMITGEQPFQGDTPMQVVLKHINEPVPRLRDQRDDLPPALDRVLQRALAKLPQNRYKTAMEFAEDFSRAIKNTDAQAVLEEYAIPSPTPTARVPQIVKPDIQPTPTQPASTATDSQAGSTQPSVNATAPTIIMQQNTNPLLLLGGFAIIAVLLVIVVLVVTNQTSPAAVSTPVATSTTAAVVENVTTPVESTPMPTFGRLSFSSMKQLGDTVTLQVQNLVPPNNGQVYAAWMQNTRDGSLLSLGELTVDALGNGVLPPFTDPEGRSLPVFYNAIRVTLQEAMSEEPTGMTAYSGRVPLELGEALSEILLASGEGFDGKSLMNGALVEARFAMQHAELAQNASNLGGITTHIEHVLNILNGTEIDYNGNGRAENPGRGVGVPHFLLLIAAQLDMVANAPDATREVQNNLELIRACVNNTYQRVEEINALAPLIQQSTDTSAALENLAQLVSIADALISGTDANGNGQVEPFEGECGLEQISTYGVLVSAIQLQQGDIDQ